VGLGLGFGAGLEFSTISEVRWPDGRPRGVVLTSVAVAVLQGAGPLPLPTAAVTPCGANLPLAPFFSCVV
jgi:hypothetical protein